MVEELEHLFFFVGLHWVPAGDREVCCYDGQVPVFLHSRKVLLSAREGEHTLCQY